MHSDGQRRVPPSAMSLNDLPQYRASAKQVKFQKETYFYVKREIFRE